MGLPGAEKQTAANTRIISFIHATIQSPVKHINRSLLIAILACLAMGLFAKSPQFRGGRSWITVALGLATLGLAAWGFFIGLRGAKRLNTAWAWLAPSVNALLFIFFSLFLALLFKTNFPF